MRVALAVTKVEVPGIRSLRGMLIHPAGVGAQRVVHPAHISCTMPLHARNARENPSTDSYPLENATSVTDAPSIRREAATDSLRFRAYSKGVIPASSKKAACTWLAGAPAACAISPAVTPLSRCCSMNEMALFRYEVMVPLFLTAMIPTVRRRYLTCSQNFSQVRQLR